MPTHILPFSIENIPSFNVDDRIFLGEGLFETLRVKNQRPCYTRLHWERMCQAAQKLGIALELSFEQWDAALVNAIKIAGIQTGGIKAILSGGSASRGLASQGKTSFLAYEVFNFTHHKKPLNLVSATWLRDAKNPIYQFKSVNYLEAILARRQALVSGADDALFFNLDQNATETTVANLFIIKQDKIITPPLSSGLLAGVTRGRILHLAREFNIMSAELPVNRNMIWEADAVFVTNSLQGIQSIKSFDLQDIPEEHTLMSLLRHALDAEEFCFE